MSVLNLENAKWLIATLAIPAALGLVAHEYQQSQAERQINDARLRLYTELLSKREEADTAVRRGIFDKVLERYLAPGDQGLQSKLGVAPVRWTVNCFRDRHRALSEGGTEVASPVTIVDPEGTVRSLVPRDRS